MNWKLCIHGPGQEVDRENTDLEAEAEADHHPQLPLCAEHVLLQQTVPSRVRQRLDCEMTQ